MENFKLNLWDLCPPSKGYFRKFSCQFVRTSVKSFFAYFILNILIFSASADTGCLRPIDNPLRIYDGYVTTGTVNGPYYSGGNNYVVYNSGVPAWTCNNHPEATYAINVSSYSTFNCKVGDRLFNNGYLVTYNIFRCPIDDYVPWLILPISILGFFFFRKYGTRTV
ncbi:hypothetical protein [Pedobacter aquatilis]|uniref:hypothetical protein n=1 Tax=Pedobacter aquatilis TaxID=351343 RepID=UPI00293194E1|nr:hypothetical protein [Pedobacter aquatilis]